MKLAVALKRLNRGEAVYLLRSVTGANGMIVTSTVEDLEIPHELGNFIGIRQLSGLEMDDAQAIMSTKATKRYAALGADVMKSLREGRDDSQVVPTETDPVDQYDHEFLLITSIVRWSGPNYDGIAVNDDNKKALDKTTKDWLVKEIVSRNHVPLVSSTTSETSTTEDTSQEN